MKRATSEWRSRSVPRESVQVPGDLLAGISAWDVMEMRDIVKQLREAGEGGVTLRMSPEDAKQLRALEKLLQGVGPYLPT